MARECVECGNPVTQKKKGPPAEFCSEPCRQTWKNRRMTRGAILYDLVMDWRFNRNGTGPEAFALLCKAAATFNYQDKNERDGRRSNRRFDEVRLSYPEFQSIDML